MMRITRYSWVPINLTGSPRFARNDILSSVFERSRGRRSSFAVEKKLVLKKRLLRGFLDSLRRYLSYVTAYSGAPLRLYYLIKMAFWNINQEWLFYAGCFL